MSLDFKRDLQSLISYNFRVFSSITKRTIFNFKFSICHVTTWFNGNLLLWVEPLNLPVRKALRKRRYYVLSFSWDLTILHIQRVMWLHGWLPVTIRYHLATSGGIGLVEVEILSFRFDKRPLVITCSESCNSIRSFASLFVGTVQILVGIRLLKEEIFGF